MGYRLKYHNLTVIQFTNLSNKLVFGVVEGSKLISTVKGLTQSEAEQQLKEYSQIREYKFP